MSSSTNPAVLQMAQFKHLMRVFRVVIGLWNLQVAGERVYRSRNVIALDDFSLAIHRDTAVNKYTEKFELDEERVNVRLDGGAHSTTVSLGSEERLDGFVIASNTTAPCGRISAETVEVRQLIEGGLAHVQKIHVWRSVAAGQSTTVRTWVRVPLTQDDQMRLLS